MPTPAPTRTPSSRGGPGRDGRRGPFATLRERFDLRLQAARRRDTACLTCGHVNDLVVARWCGRCGVRLRDVVVDVGQGDRPRRDARHLRRVATPIFVAVLGVAMLVPAALQGEDAPPRGESARGDATRTGVVSDQAPNAPREVAWTVEGTEPGLGAPTLAAATDHAIVLQPGTADILDLATGAPIRNVNLAATRENWAGALAVGDRLLVPDAALGALRAIGVTDGQELWQVPFAGFPRVPETPEMLAVVDDVVVPSGLGVLQRIDLDGTTLDWQADLANRDGLGFAGFVGQAEQVGAMLTVSPPGAQIQVGSAGAPSLSGIDLANGRLVWNVALVDVDALAPTAANDRLVVHQDSSRGPQPVLVVRDATDGSEFASLPFRGPLVDVAVIGNVVLVLDQTGVRGWVDRGAREAFSWPVELPTAPLLVSQEPARVLFPEGEALRILDLGGAPVAMIAAEGATSHALVGGVVLTAQTGLRTSAWDLAGNQLWTRLLGAPATAGLATDGTLVAANVPAGLVVIDGRKGERLTSVERIDTDGVRAEVPGSVALDDGMVVVSPFGGGPSGRGLSALDASTGIGRWDRTGDSPPAVGPITRTPGVAWVPVADEVHGYDTAFGRRTFASLAGIPRGPLAVTAEVVVGTNALPVCAGLDACPGAVNAIEVESREVAWTSPAPACGPPSIRDGRVLVPTTAGPWALGVTDGGLLWSSESAATHNPGCGPLAVGESMIVQGKGRTLSAWEPTQGAATWTVDLGESLATDPVIAGDEVVVTTTDGQMTALDLLTGDLAWQFRLPAPALVDPVIVDNRWILLLRDGRIVGLR